MPSCSAQAIVLKSLVFNCPHPKRIHEYASANTALQSTATNVPRMPCQQKKVLYTKAKHLDVYCHTKASLYYLSITHGVFKYMSENILIGFGKLQVSSFVYPFCKDHGLVKVNRTEPGRTAP